VDTSRDGISLKSRGELRTLTEKERMRVFNDPEYIRACEFHYPNENAKT
jgi:hypothetical protein